MSEELDQNDPKAATLRRQRFELASIHADSVRYARFLAKALNLAERRARGAGELTLAAVYHTRAEEAEKAAMLLGQLLLPKP